MNYLIIILALFSSLTFAADVIPCNEATDNYFRWKNTTLTVYKSEVSGCVLTVKSNKVADQYRSFSFSSESHLMIFNSFSLWGNPKTDTGARSMYLLPKIHDDVRYLVSPDERFLVILTPDDRSFVFETAGTEIIFISEADWKLDYSINPNNDGGLELIPTSGQVLDFGWRLGGDPRVRMDHDSVFLQGHKECHVNNKEVLTPIYDDRDMIDGWKLIYSSEHEVSNFLKKRCSW